MKSALAFGLRSIARKDSSAMRTQMFHCYLENHPASSFLWSILDSVKFSFFGLALILLKGINDVFRYEISLSDSSKVIVYHYPNELKVLAPLTAHETQSIKWGERWSWTEVHGGWLLRVLNKKKFLQTSRVVRMLVKKNSLLVVLRQVQFILSYSFFNHLFEYGRARDFYASTESNPEILGVILAASKNSNKIVYVNHGQLDQELGLFSFDHYLLSAQAVKDRILPLQKNLNATYEFYALQSQRQIKIPTAIEVRKILVFTPVVLEFNLLKMLLSDLNKNWPSVEISLRLHPNTQLMSDKFPLDLSKQVCLTNNRRYFIEDLNGVDLCIGGGSSAHLEALSEGIPSFYYRLDSLPDDHYGFLFKKLIPEIHSTSNLVSIASAFYDQESWSHTFAYFQHSERE